MGKLRVNRLNDLKENLPSYAVLGDSSLEYTVQASEFDRLCEDLKSDKQYVEFEDIEGCQCFIRAVCIEYISLISKETAELLIEDSRNAQLNGD